MAECPVCGKAEFRHPKHRANHVKKHAFEVQVEAARVAMSTPTRRAAWVEEIDGPHFTRQAVAA